MRIFLRFALGLGVLGLIAPLSLAGSGVTIHIQNDSVDNLSVSVYDRGLGRKQPVVSGQVINGNGSISITVSANAQGQGHLSWTAVTVDSDMRRCGHHDNSGLNDGDTVRVHADAACPIRRRR
jgi:hypothetical protein